MASRQDYPVGDLHNGQFVQYSRPQPLFGATTRTVSNSAYATNLTVKTTRGILYGFYGYNSKASAQYLLMFDRDNVPAANTIPDFAPFVVAATSNFSLDFGIYGIKFNTGLVIVNSSTPTLLTVGSADIWVTATVDNLELGSY